MMLHRFLTLVALTAAIVAPALAGDEACRIRVDNEVNGLVQVSLDSGKAWSTVGRVRTPANARIFGFAAASYIPHGTVAATAVHGIRIKTGQYTEGIGKAQKAMLFSIEPREFSKMPNGYGGHAPRCSGIYTDIFAGHSIFRNESPYVGDAVYVERDHKLIPLPEDYTPIEGETFIITVTRPDKAISEIVFENKASGDVTVRYPDGSSEVIAAVDRPVKGTGRYDGTTFTGVGAVNTSHGGVLTISTAPTCFPMTEEGGPDETRGGFMIQPYFHVEEQGETKPQVMVIGPKDSKVPHVEGTPPIFFGNINLSRYEGYPECSFRAQVKLDGCEWQEVPKVIGKVDDSLANVTAVRLLFPRFDKALLARDLAREAADYSKRVTEARTVHGTVFLAPPEDGAACAGSLVNYYVDGSLENIASAEPSSWNWDSTTVPNGLHEIEIERVNGSSTIVVSRQVVWVKN